MIRFTTSQIVELINSIVVSLSIEADPINEVHQRKAVLRVIEKRDSHLFELLEHFINTWESYEFLKKDRDFMMKGRDLWNMQIDLFKSELEKSWGKLKNHLEEEKIAYTITTDKENKI